MDWRGPTEKDHFCIYHFSLPGQDHVESHKLPPRSRPRMSFREKALWPPGPNPCLRWAPTLPRALPPVPETPSLPGLQGSWFLGGHGSISQRAGEQFPERLRDKGIRRVLPSRNGKGGHTAGRERCPLFPVILQASLLMSVSDFRFTGQPVIRDSEVVLA